MRWLEQGRKKNIPISDDLLKKQAKIFATKLGVQGFKASDRWLSKLKARNGITTSKICGEADNVNAGVSVEGKEGSEASEEEIGEEKIVGEIVEA